MGNQEKVMPKVQDLVHYNLAVAGHAGTLCDADGDLFIKPCTQAEIDFYDSAGDHPEFASLMPIRFGTLMLNADAKMLATIKEQIPASLPPKVAEHIHEEIQEAVADFTEHILPKAALKLEQSNDAAKNDGSWTPSSKTKRISTDTAIVLENMACGYKRPNILDAKLGVRLWADDAPQQKRERFDRIAAETTHAEFGFRIAGMRVYKGGDDPAALDREGYRIYDKDYGRFDVNNDNIVQSMRGFIYNVAAGIDHELGQAIATAFLHELCRVKEVLEKQESRMYSSSLLFVFEGDGQALRTAIEETSANARGSIREGKEEYGGSLGRSTYRVDSGIDMGDDGELIFSGEEDSAESEDDEEGGIPAPILTLKLIDFAHAEWTPGQGPDENMLKGVRGLVRIFEELAKYPPT